MQISYRSRSLRKLAAGLLALSAINASLPAAVRYWDANGSGTGIGGTGTWQLGAPALWNGSSTGTGTLYNWVNNTSAPDIAHFGGTAGTVSVVSSTENPIVALSLVFSTAGYTLSGGAITMPLAGTQTIVEVQATGGDTIVNNDLNLVVPVDSSGPRYRIFNRSAGTLTLNGNVNLVMDASTTSRTYDVDQFDAGGKIILNGTFSSNPGDGTASIRFGENGGVDGVTYEMNGNNINGLDGGSRLYRGTLLLGHANALGGAADKIIRLGGSGTLAGQTAAILTNAAMTIVNDITLGNSGSTTATYILGGATAEASIYSGGITANNSMPLTLRAAAGGTVEFSGFINHMAAKMIKDGAGTVSLTRAAGNSGTGDVEVKAGTLLVTNTSGSAHGSGNITVETGATLGGTGRIAPGTGTKLTLQSGAVLLGGLGEDSTGTLTIQGGVDFLSNSVIKLVLGPDNAHSSIARTGTGVWSFQADQLFTFDLLDGADTGTYAGILTGIAAGTDVSGWRVSPSTGIDGYFQMSGTNVDFIVSAIPEPSTALLLTAGLMTITLLRRRRATI